MSNINLKQSHEKLFKKSLHSAVREYVKYEIFLYNRIEMSGAERLREQPSTAEGTRNPHLWKISSNAESVFVRRS